MMRVVSVVGARPNFVKIAPVIREMRNRGRAVEPLLVHTGQHYDDTMSEAFFDDLGIPKPEINLEVGSGSHAHQTARIMLAFEAVIEQLRPDWVVVVGDVNSTLAATLVAVKLLVKVAHVEAGLRSGDRTMPEEINRILTDAVADLLLTPSRDANTNLLREGIAPEKIRFVGNVMIDSLRANLERAKESKVLETMGLERGGFGVVTLHRPSNVDDRSTLTGILDAIAAVAEQLPVVFPVHPRTRTRIEEFGLMDRINASPNLVFTSPLGYLDFLRLYSNSRIVFTDSGGIQEETTVLGIPCLTLRDTTERPITVSEGSNIVVGSDPDRISREAFAVLASPERVRRVPELWDGRAAQRIVDAILESKPS
jgi:UDP-N-acetylglucosamine 2-epimerase (non-hydrolysing)